MTPEARQTLAETITPARDDTGDVERGSWEGSHSDSCRRSLTLAGKNRSAVHGPTPARNERQNHAQGLAPLAPCRDCGREKPVNRWCTATEECQAHTDAALEAEEQRREAGK